MKTIINFIDCNIKQPSKKNRIGIIPVLVLCENNEIREAQYIGNGIFIASHGLQFGIDTQMGEGSKVTHWAYIENL